MTSSAYAIFSKVDSLQEDILSSLARTIVSGPSFDEYCRSSCVIFFLPLITILPYFCGLTGVEICQAVSDIFALTVSIPLGVSVIKEMKRDDTNVPQDQSIR